MPYGLANTDYAAEKAYEAVIGILRQVQEHLPERLAQMCVQLAYGVNSGVADGSSFLNKSLPAIPLINRFKLESTCYATQPSSAFPHAIMTGVLAHAAVHVAALRHRVKELWSIVLHLLDNEYRQPRLQTLQMALLDIFGRPTLNPGGNHIAISRVSLLARYESLLFAADRTGYRNSATTRIASQLCEVEIAVLGTPEPTAYLVVPLHRR